MIPRPQSTATAIGSVGGVLAPGKSSSSVISSSATPVEEEPTTSAAAPAPNSNAGPPHQAPHPQSTASDIGSAGGILNPGKSGGYLGSTTTAPLEEGPVRKTTSLAPVQPTTAQPAPSPSAVNPEPTTTPPTQTSAAELPVGGGGHGGLPIPRPQTSVTALGPVGGGPVTESFSFTHTCKDCNIPQPQSSVTSLGSPGGPSEVAPPQTTETAVSAAPSPEPSVFFAPKHTSTPVVLSATAPHVISIGTSAVTADSSSQYVIGSQTLAPGSSAITQSGVVYSLPSSATAVIVGPSTQSITPQAPPSTPVITLAGSTLTANSASQFQIGSQTLAPGSAITSAGQVISLASSASAVVVNGQTQQITPQYATLAPVITVGTSEVTANSQSQYVIGSQTLSAGSPAITVSNQVLSLGSGGSAVVINGQTQQISPAYSTPAPVITVGSSKITANAQSQYVIGSQTLSAGSPAITVSNQVLSLASGGSALVFGSSTGAIAEASTFAVSAPPILTLGTQSITANSQSAYVIGHQTLLPGSQIIIAGSTLSLAPSATALVVNGQTSSLSPQSILATVAPPLITLGPSTLTANHQSAYVVAGQTLSPGGSAITVSGTRLSLASGAQTLVVGTSTSLLHPQILALTTAPPILTLGNSPITANSASNYILAGQTLSAGGSAITVSGTRLSLASDGLDLVIGTSTSLLHPEILALSTEAPVLSLGTARITAAANAPSDYIIGSQTLLPGHAITVSGTILSLASNEAFLKIGSSTESLSGSVVVETESASASASSLRAKEHNTKVLAAAAATSGMDDLTLGAEPTIAPSSGSATGGKKSGAVSKAEIHWLAAGCAAGIVLGTFWL